MKQALTVQVDSGHYQNGYDHKLRWIAYFYQIDTVRGLNAKTVLEVGPGNGTVSSYLNKMGIEVTTVDIDPALAPTAVASVLDLPFPDNHFDVAMACEVLEHLPFEKFSDALRELARVSKGNVFISLPDARHSLLYLVLKLPFLREIAFRLRMMKRVEHRFDGEHYWEIGKRGFPPSRVRAAIAGCGLAVVEEFVAPDAPYYHFFLMHAGPS